MINFQIPESLTFILPGENDEVRTFGAYGGRGSAKSWSFARAILGRCCLRPTRWLCAREFQSSIRESVHQLLCSQIEMVGLGSDFDIQRDQIIGPNGSVISYVGLHDKSLDNLKSYEGYDGCWVEEAQSMTKRSLQYLKPTIRKDGSQIWYSFNPEDEDDPIYQELVIHTPKNAIVAKVSWFDNPWFNDVLRQEMQADYELDAEAADWIWGGNCRRVSDKQVLRGKLEIRPFEPGPNWDGPYHGLDFGYGQDPLHGVRCWVWEGDLYIEFEAYGEKCEIEDHPACLDLIPGIREHVLRCDNARPEMVSYLKRNGFPRAVSCQKWAGCVEDRVSFLRSFHRIIINPTCPEIIKQGKLWSWKVTKGEDILNVLQPGWDHGWDAVGYALEPLILGKKRIVTPPKPGQGLNLNRNGQNGWMQ